ncbi:hypothetical protein PQR62_03780 [Herbaspirillum lusitanum]|jgi:hypothetical protein|uniref:Uncharacterized protein n=1 Tax=Herbaspirillum lusitanum TaxID=213312 RepID=A0ABW9A6T2_9BURK
MKKIAVLGLLALSGLMVSGASNAHPRFYGGVVIGGPIWVPPPVYYSPPPVYVERTPPPVYIERAPQPENYWYYCPETKAYYPYVQSCPSNWMRVVPNGPNGNQPPQ